MFDDQEAHHIQSFCRAPPNSLAYDSSLPRMLYWPKTRRRFTPSGMLQRTRSLAFRSFRMSSLNLSLASPATLARRVMSSAADTEAAAARANADNAVLTLPDVSLDHLKDKVVFVRCDFNVKYDKAPTGGYVVKKTSFKRIAESLPTLRHLCDAGARVVVASHMGDPTKEELADPAAREKLSLRPVAAALEASLGQPVVFAADCQGPVAAEAAAAVSSGGLLLLENLRFHAGEKKNDPAFAQAIVDAVKPAAYVNDAFGTGKLTDISPRVTENLFVICTACNQFITMPSLVFCIISHVRSPHI